MYGIRQFQAIINPPQVAILAVGALQKVAVFDADDRVRPVQRLTVTLSADHRATDGAEAAGFLNVLQTALEDAFVLVE
jgi:pyruvate dehydrogenase E2 component (dihydrolipoamide acetyltransferase)